jgi:hypothetical protein
MTDAKQPETITTFRINSPARKLDGSVVVVPAKDGQPEKTLSIRHLLLQMFYHPMQVETKEVALQIYRLAQKIQNAPDRIDAVIILNQWERGWIEMVAAAVFPPITFGQIYDALEGIDYNVPNETQAHH